MKLTTKATVNLSFWRRVFGCLLFGLVSCLVQDVIAASLVATPQDLVAFTSDVTVLYEYSSDESVQSPYLELYDVATDSVRATEILRELSGEVRFNCVLIDHAGVFVIRMLSAPNDDVITQSANLMVTWPSFSFRTPEKPETFSTLTVTAQPISGDLCTETIVDSLTLVLNFIGLDDSLPNSEPSGENVARTRIEILNDEIVGEFPCDVITKEGFYTVSLESVYQSAIISTSDIFKVKTSSSITFTFSSDFTADCSNNLNITYAYSASCDFVPQKIVVYVSSDPAVSYSDLQKSSLDEVTSYVADNFGELNIDCETFETDVYSGYCFKYEGLSGSGDGIEATTRCLPTRQPETGGWGPWSDWEPCTASCGDSIRRRTRVCIGDVGNGCQGNPYNVANCEVPRCPDYDDFPRIIPRDVDPEAITPPSCNYALSTISGTIVASPQSCPRGAAWVIRVANNKRIRLEFLTFNLYLPQEYVRIRDGVNARAKILAFNTGQLIPSTVTSTGNQIYVEYEVFAKGKPPERGFSATYTSLDLPKPKPSAAGALAEGDEDAGGMSNHTTIILAVGISLLVLLLLLSLVMTIIIRFKEERHQFNTGAIQKIYTGPRGSFNSSTTRSNQRLFGVPGHSTTSPSEHSHQSVSKRGFPDGNGNGDRSQMYLIPENSNMQYLPETTLSSPFKSPSEMQSITELPSPYKEETGPKWPVPKKDLSLPFHFGNPNQSVDNFSRQSEVTDKNTIHLSNKTPSEYTTRGYSARGSTRGSRSSVDSKRTDASRQKRVHANVVNSDNTSPFVSPNGELTPEGMNASGKVLKRPTRLNRSPEGAESPDNYHHNNGTLTRHKSNHDHDGQGSERKHQKSHRSGTRSSKSGLSSDAGLYSPDSTADRSGGSKSGSTRPSRSHRHHHHQGGKRRKSPSKEEHISMKDINSSRSSSQHHKRKHSPTSPRSKSRQSETKSPRSPRSHSSSGSGRKYHPNSNSRAPAKHGTKLYSPATSENSRYNSLPYSRGTDSSLGNLSPVSEPSPIRLPKPLTIKQNRDQYKQVFISDESLMNKIGSGTERSGAESSRSGLSNRQLPNTPSSGSGSPTKSLNVRRVYSDKSLSPEEPAFDNYMPSIPGSYFENPYPQHVPSGPTSGGNLSVV